MKIKLFNYEFIIRKEKKREIYFDLPAYIRSMRNPDMNDVAEAMREAFKYITDNKYEM
jgi:hypothetical protein